jgi:uncharacterized protein with HEPN domain
LEAIDHIQEALSATTPEKFAEDHFQKLAIEVISEASRWIPADLKGAEPGIGWRRMADLGNQLRHAYHRIDPSLLWTIAERDLPPLRLFVERIVQNDQK